MMCNTGSHERGSADNGTSSHMVHLGLTEIAPEFANAGRRALIRAYCREKIILSSTCYESQGYCNSRDYGRCPRPYLT